MEFAIGILITVILTVAGFFVVTNKIKQKQKVSDGSVGIQAGNNAKINIKNDKTDTKS